MSTLTFFGAAGIVTGSCTLLDTGGARCLVDCGLFQGNRSVRALNEKPFPFDPSRIDAVLLTHAHTDHAGLLPKLAREGFAGPILATGATADLLQFMLRDSAKIQEGNAERRNRYLARRGLEPEPPVFGMDDAEAALGLVETVAYEDWVAPVADVKARFRNAGHILGSASIEVKYPEPGTGRTFRLLFSGDLGPDEKAFHPEPAADRGFDYVVCESTYGDRERADYTLHARRQALRRELVEALDRGGNVVIPSFAVERSQELLHDIGVLLARDEIPAATVFLDSPLARKVTDVFAAHAGALEDLEVPESRLFRDPRFRIVETVEESRAINRIHGGAIIISASGMADAGRVQHHLKHNISRPDATVLFVGYQAAGTLGALILSGAPDVRIHGRDYRVRARIRSIGNYSAHADQGELVAWVLARAPIAGGLFLNHGEDPARRALRDRLVERGLPADRIWLPGVDESFELAAGTPASKGRAAERIAPDELVRDWHAEYAAFVIDLGNRLESETSPARRRKIVAAVRGALEDA